MNLRFKQTIMAAATAGIAISSLGTIKADAFGIGDVDFKVVNTNSLNVRTEPNTKSLVKRKLKNGDVVRPVELNESKTWARIGKDEWVSLKYLEMMDNSTIPENGVEYEKLDTIPYIINVDSLELRNEPSVKSEVVGTFKKGTKVFATEANGAWIKIEDGHNAGWVVKDYLKPYSSENANNMPSNNDNNTVEKPSINFKEETVSTKKLKLKVSSAKIRKAPSMDAQVVGYVQQNIETFESNTISGNWYKVNINGKEGWLHKDCTIEVKNTTNNNTVAKPSTNFKEETISTKEIEIKVNSANIRKAPSMDAQVVGYAKNGELSFTSVVSGDWYKTNFNGKEGWVHTSCVKDVVGSMNSTLDDLVDVAPGDVDMSMNATYDELVDVAPGDVDMTRTVNVSEGSALNVRYTRALGGSVKDRLPAGTKVTEINESNGVSYIKYVNAKGFLEFGYVASQYLK